MEISHNDFTQQLIQKQSLRLDSWPEIANSMLSPRCLLSLVLTLSSPFTSPSCDSTVGQDNAASSTDQSSWPLPHNITGFNRPGTWGGIHLHDPSIVKGPDRKYYSFSTHGLISTSRADSLNGNWKHLGPALSAPSVVALPGRNDTWAPDVHHANGTYHAYYSVSTFGSQKSGVGVATSKTLLPGSWTDHGAVLTSGKDESSPLDRTNAIDPNLFVDAKTGDAYLNYGSFWKGIWQFKLKPDLKSVDKSWTPRQLSFEPKGTNPEEGAFLHEKDGWYYLWVSQRNMLWI
jgi:arabinan endo-1,5-alpha-L-arabinosidase